MEIEFQKGKKCMVLIEYENMNNQIVENVNNNLSFLGKTRCEFCCFYEHLT